ncbi:MAG: LTA synthase family protein [Fibrobacter sp.]|nr:LTA synthase family protein [Fibrobacter sp.]
MPKRWHIVFTIVKIIVLEECLSYVISATFMNTRFLPEWKLIFSSLIFAASLVYLLRKLPYQKMEVKKGIGIFVIAYLCVFFQDSIVWGTSTFPLHDVNAVLFTLQMPIDGFDSYFIEKYLKFIFVDSLKITLLVFLFLILGLKRNHIRYYALMIYFICSLFYLFIEIPIAEYINAYKNYGNQYKLTNSVFFQEHYVHAEKVKVTPPTSKRNLVFVFLESMETTFSDFTPELNQLAKENLSFGEKNPIGGGDDVLGTTFTLGSYVGKTTGMPILNKSSYRNGYNGFKSLYDFLREQDYRQYVVQGTIGSFAGLNDFLKNEEIDAFYDYDDIAEGRPNERNGLSDVLFKWSVNDRSTFAFAKSVLDTIKEPFSLTLFTIDTHFPDGMYDEQCGNKPSDADATETYKAIVQCTSTLTQDFVNYLKQKDFYENTTVVIVGDHNFMGKHLVNNKPNRKWINIFINSVKEPSNPNRYFSDLDMFPTILSALGYEIEGDRLGLGVNLFSDEKTLLEIYGADSLNKLIGTIPGSIEFNQFLWGKEHE